MAAVGCPLAPSRLPPFYLVVRSRGVVMGLSLTLLTLQWGAPLGRWRRRWVVGSRRGLHLSSPPICRLFASLPTCGVDGELGDIGAWVGQGERESGVGQAGQEWRVEVGGRRWIRRGEARRRRSWVFREGPASATRRVGTWPLREQELALSAAVLGRHLLRPHLPRPALSPSSVWYPSSGSRAAAPPTSPSLWYPSNSIHAAAAPTSPLSHPSGGGCAAVLPPSCRHRICCCSHLAVIMVH
ncbi:hypothetical protein BDZ97DRAFT_1921239 [Flammula alnicola]|nr:hypothetical protein BDZ97DRAFT_1921239 [Flammula alnicola]